MSEGPIEISFVLPVHDEVESLPALFRALDALLDRLGASAEVVLVDDGSADGSLALLLERVRVDPRFRVLELSRNFGQQAAICAGLDVARGLAVVVMDADLQDPPEAALEMVARWREGFEVVHGVRSGRAEGWFKRASAGLFYRVLRRFAGADIVADSGEFRLLDRKAVEALRGLRERHRFVRGLSRWIGFRQTVVRYDRPQRAAGRTKYPLRRMLSLAAGALVSVSDAPLRLAAALGLVLSLVSLLGGAALLALGTGGPSPALSAWVLAAVCILGGTQLLLLAVMALYVARIHSEVQGRPIYIARAFHGAGTGAPDGRAAAASAAPRG